jgi:hypothetical protein
MSRAQNTTTLRPKSQTALVLDFDDKSGYPNKLQGRQAADAVARELSNSQGYEILTRKTVQDKANELNLRPLVPGKLAFDDIAIAKLAAELGATTVIAGEVSFIKIDTKAKPKSVRVGVKVRIKEAASGDTLNGAAQIGDSRERPGVSDNDALVDEGLRNAATLCVKQIVSSSLPEGTILSSVNDIYVINRGARDGIISGMDLIVFRGGQRVGKVRVINVFPTDCEARVVDLGIGIRPEDKVRPLFPMPDFAKDGTLATANNSRVGGGRGTGNSLGKLLVVLLVGVAIYAAVAGGSSSTVTGLIAEADINNAAPAVRLNWRDNIFGANTIEYHVWRTPNFTFGFQADPVAAVSGGARNYTDFPAPYTFWTTGRQYLRANTNGGNNNNGGNNGGNGLASLVTPATPAPTGFVTGNSINYQLTSIVRRTVVSGGNNNNNNNNNGGLNQEDVESAVVLSGQVTPINRAVLTSPADQVQNVDLDNIRFQWNSTRGADEFQVEISTDRTFSNRSLIVQLPIVFSTAPNSDGVTQQIPAAISIRGNAILRRDLTFARFADGVVGAAKPTVFWRVGGRNSGDRPGPVHAITRSQTDNDRSFRFIYSEIRSFQPAELPPAAPKIKK